MRTFFTLIVVTIVSLTTACTQEEKNCSEVSGCVEPDVDGGNTPDGGPINGGNVSDAAYCPLEDFPKRCEGEPEQCQGATYDCNNPAFACGGRMMTCYESPGINSASCCNDQFYVCADYQRYCPDTGQCFDWHSDTDPPMEVVCPSHLLECSLKSATCQN